MEQASSAFDRLFLIIQGLLVAGVGFDIPTEKLDALLLAGAAAFSSPLPARLVAHVLESAVVRFWARERCIFYGKMEKMCHIT